MKRKVALVGLMLVAAASVLVIQRASRDREYLRLLQAGEQALHTNTYAAIEAFTGAITLRPDSMVAYFHRGEAYRAQGQDAEAVRDLREAHRLAPDAPQPLVALGDLYDRTDATQAAFWYGQAETRLNSEDPALLYKLGLARYRAGSPAEAAKPLRQALARNDSIAEAHYLLGLVYRDTQHLDDAIASLERAVKLAPALMPAREELADLYRARGRFVDEMGQLQALSVLDARKDHGVDIALAQARHGQFPAALGTLTDTAARTPGDPRVQMALGRVFLARAERTPDRAAIARATTVLEQALGTTPRRSEGLALLGRAQYLNADYEAAERTLREAVATSPVDPDAFGYLADAAERLAHLTDARDALVTWDVLQGDTVSIDVRAARAQRIGALSLRANDIPTAVSYLTQAVSAGKQDARTLGQLAQARFQSGDLPAANEALSRALAMEPRNPELLRLRRVIR